MRKYLPAFSNTPLFTRRALRGSQKVEIAKNDTQKIIPPWPPRLRVQPFPFPEDEKPKHTSNRFALRVIRGSKK
jgi:hypothetical protein